MFLVFVTAALGADRWPDIVQPQRTGRVAPDDVAVVVGNETYAYLPDVPHANRDAQAVTSWLVYTRGVPADRVRHLSGASAPGISEAVKQAAAQVGDSGTLWLYFAGHGIADPQTGARRLVGVNTMADTVDDVLTGSVRVADLVESATEAGRPVVVVADACYNGFGRDGAQLDDKRWAVPTYATQATPNVVEWYASAPSEVAGPLPGAQHGAFTYFVVGALRGWADGELDQTDGEVVLDEARAFVDRAMRESGVRGQTPTLHVGDVDPGVLSHATAAAPALGPRPRARSGVHMGASSWAVVGGLAMLATAGATVAVATNAEQGFWNTNDPATARQLKNRTQAASVSTVLLGVSGAGLLVGAQVRSKW